MTTLPFIGNLNTVFVVAVGLGMGLVLLMMVFHIINSLRAKDLGEALFDTNGVAGLVFYGAVAAVVVLFMTGHSLPAGIVLVVMFAVPLLVIACKEPLTNKLNKKKELIEGGKGMFVVQAFFEMFEVLLSYFSNTPFLCAYRSLCGEPCGYDAGCAHAGRSGKRGDPQHHRHYYRQPDCLRYGRAYCGDTGPASSVL